MTRPSLKSRFGEQIRAFVGYKNSLGFPYDESIRILGRFDDFCVERFPEKDCLDRELALAWLEKRDTENTAGHRNRIMVIREFAKYLRAVGTEAYMIPISMTSKGPRYVPHIFNEAEIKAFFHGADSFRPHEKAPARHLVIPVFYRLLYCCGLRPAEARLLKKENVDLVRGAVYVVESKGHKDRVVAVADDLLQIMRSYSTLISEIYPDSDYFFPRYDGEGPYTKRWTEEMFWRCFSMAGITAFEGPKPRVYDFRHTFATECICRWMREGRDIDAMLPFLSAYMGHARYWHPKTNQWFCRRCGMWAKPLRAEETSAAIAEKLCWLRQNPEIIHTPEGQANVQSVEVALLDREIWQALTNAEPEVDALVAKILHRAEMEYKFCTAGDADPVTLQIQKACAEYKPTEEFPETFYKEVISKVILYRDTHIEFKLQNGQIV